MGWPFQSSSQKEASARETASGKKGLLGRLFSKPEAGTPSSAQPESYQATQSQNKWDLPPESFDAVAQLLEESRKKAPNQPLMTNPYRTSLSLDDEAEAPVPVGKEKQPSWSFDPTQVDLGQPKSSRLKQVKEEILNDVLVETPISDSDMLPPSLVEETFPLELESSHDVSPDKLETLQDDFGLTSSVPDLPVGSSLQELVNDNVLSFVSEQPKPVDAFQLPEIQPLGMQNSDEPLEAIELNDLLQSDNKVVSSFEIAVASEEPLLEGMSFSPLEETSELTGDWFSAGTGDQESPIFSLDTTEEDLEVKSVEDLPEEIFEAKLPINSHEEDVFAQAVSENAIMPQVVDEAIPADNWFAGSLTDVPEMIETSDEELESIVDSFGAGTLLLNETVESEESDVFTIISLDPEEDVSSVTSETDFFSEQHQFSLASLQEEEYDAASVASTWLDGSFEETSEQFYAPESSVEELLQEQSAVLEFQPVSVESGTNTLDLDESVDSYPQYLESEINELEEDTIFELTDSVTAAFTPEAIEIFNPEAVEDIPDMTVIEPTGASVAEECLEPPPLSQVIDSVLSPSKVVADVSLSSRSVPFEANVLLKESRFTKQSIDRLVAQYFTNRQE